MVNTHPRSKAAYFNWLKKKMKPKLAKMFFSRKYKRGQYVPAPVAMARISKAKTLKRPISTWYPSSKFVNAKRVLSKMFWRRVYTPNAKQYNPNPGYRYRQSARKPVFSKVYRYKDRKYAI